MTMWKTYTCLSQQRINTIKMAVKKTCAVSRQTIVDDDNLT